MSECFAISARIELAERHFIVFFAICLQGEKVPPPIKSFREMKLPDAMLSALEAKGIKRPTPIQVKLQKGRGEKKICVSLSLVPVAVASSYFITCMKFILERNFPDKFSALCST